MKLLGPGGVKQLMSGGRTRRGNVAAECCCKCIGYTNPTSFDVTFSGLSTTLCAICRTQGGQSYLFSGTITISLDGTYTTDSSGVYSSLVSDTFQVNFYSNGTCAGSPSNVQAVTRQRVAVVWKCLGGETVITSISQIFFLGPASVGGLVFQATGNFAKGETIANALGACTLTGAAGSSVPMVTAAGTASVTWTGP